MASTTKTMSENELVDVVAETMAGVMRQVRLDQVDDLARVIAVAALGHLRITQGDEWVQRFMAGFLMFKPPHCQRPVKH